MSFKQAFLTSLFSALVAADFQIYTNDFVQGNFFGEVSSGSGFYFLAGPPSCDDICNSIFTASNDDVSGASGARCEGCDFSRTSGGPPSWDITEFEYHDIGFNGAPEIHWTLYESAGYQITPADGSALRGSCVRDTGDDFENCSCGPGDAESGTRIFICTSDYTAADFN